MEAAILIAMWTLAVFGAGWVGCWAWQALRQDRAEQRLADAEAAELEKTIAGNQDIISVTVIPDSGSFEQELRETREMMRARAEAADPELAEAYAATAAEQDGQTEVSTRAFPIADEATVAAARTRIWDGGTGGPYPVAAPRPAGGTGGPRSLFIASHYGRDGARHSGPEMACVMCGPASGRGFHRTATGEHRGLRSDCLSCALGAPVKAEKVELHEGPGGNLHSGAREDCPLCKDEPPAEEQTQAPERDGEQDTSAGVPGGAQGRERHLAGSEIHHGPRKGCGSGICRVSDAQYRQALADPVADFAELVTASRPA